MSESACDMLDQYLIAPVGPTSRKPGSRPDPPCEMKDTKGTGEKIVAASDSEEEEEDGTGKM